MNGFNLSEAGHVAVVLPPQNISGGVTAAPFSMKNHKHASVVIALGALSGAPSQLLLYLVSEESSPFNAVAIPFSYYFQSAGGAGNDVLSAIQNAPAAGVTLSSAVAPANGCIVIEIDANELEAATGGALSGSLGVESYLQVVISDGTNTDFACIIALLSGARFANVSSPSVTV